jgi:hypothetical protein
MTHLRNRLVLIAFGLATFAALAVALGAPIKWE